MGRSAAAGRPASAAREFSLACLSLSLSLRYHARSSVFLGNLVQPAAAFLARKLNFSAEEREKMEGGKLATVYVPPSCKIAHERTCVGALAPGLARVQGRDAADQGLLHKTD